MKLRIAKRELHRALFRVQGVADKRSAMPVLAHTLLSATPEGLDVKATDLDIGMSTSYPAEVDAPGTVVVSARQAYEIVKSLPRDEVLLEGTQNHGLRVSSGPSEFHLVGMAPDQFPSLPQTDTDSTFALASAALERMIDRTLFCVSTDDNRHNLTGVHCETPRSSVLRMTSTDGHRLARVEQTFEHPVHLPESVIVPRKGFVELKRVLGDSDGDQSEVTLGFSKNRGVLRSGSTTLSMRLVEGQYPDCDQVIPKGGDKIVKVARTAFQDVLRRVSILSQAGSHGVRFDLKEGTLTCVAEDPEAGRAVESIEVDYRGPPLTAAFNARYILDVLGLIRDDGVVMTMTDDLSPAVLSPLEEPGFLAVVMPMRI